MTRTGNGLDACFAQLYKAAVTAIEANFDLLVQQAYERQLERKEVDAGW